MAKSDLFAKLWVRLPSQDYAIFIGQNFLSAEEMFAPYLASKQVLIVTNKTIAPLYLHSLQEMFKDKQCDVIVLEDGEDYKNEQSLFQIYDVLMEKEHHRDTTLIALGGGVVGDMCGFAASTYLRGVNFLQIPTTLLAQVDASVGGKTGINHPQGKNMIGAFYQPKAVFIDLNTLKTLPIREFRAGFAEIIKYAILVGGELLESVYEVLKRGVDYDTPHQLSPIITQCCQIKADVVQEDERESGRRALLNLGHTVAHALESYTNYSRWLHGEAVAIGLYCVALLSHRHYGLDEHSFKLIDELLALANLPRRIPRDIHLEQLRALMGKDKKIKNNRLRFIVVKKMGDCYLDDSVTESNLMDVLQCAVEGE